MLIDKNNSLLLAIDLQPKFLNGILNVDTLMKKGLYLTQASELLNIPHLATVQNPERMGGVHPSLEKHFEVEQIYSKMTFSVTGNIRLLERIEKLKKKQIIVWGIETPICITQSVLQLLKNHDVFLVCDAVSARDELSHNISLSRMEQAGAKLTCADSVVYEWLETAENEQFKNVLQLVKESAK